MLKIKYLMSNSRGQSLFEVVIALAISALIIVALVSLASNSIRNATFSRNNTLASRYAQEATEWLRGERDNDINLFMTNVIIPTWCLKDLSWAQSASCANNDFVPGTPFVREVDFTLTTIGGKNLVEAAIKVSWEDAQGVHEVNSSTQFTDWRQR
jgi:Tfp pilus assembly protein PilV